MADLDTEGIRTAKKALARWFCGSGERYFLPLRGPGIPVTQDEELAIRAAAEEYIRRRVERLRGQLSLTMLLMVGIPLSIYYLEVRAAREVTHVGASAIMTFSAGALLMLAAAWRYECSLFDLRDSIALSLRERAGAASEAFATPDLREPDLRRLAKWSFALAGLFLLWPAAGAVWRQFGPVAGGDWALGVIAGAIAGIVLGLLAFAAIWTLWLRRAAASSEDRAA